MAFWGCVLKPGQKHPVRIEDSDVLHLSQACLHDPKDGKNYLQVDVNGTTYSIACLEKGKREHDCLDLFFDAENTSFVAKGNSEIHLMGYLEPSDFGEGSESEEQQIVAKAASPKLAIASSPKHVAASSPKKSPKAAPVAESSEDDFDEEEEEEEEPMNSEDMSDLMEEGEESEEESPPPPTKSPKRQAPSDPQASPAKKPKTDGPSAEEKGYVQKLVDHLKANGKTNLGQLGSKVPRPAGVPKMKAVIEAHKDKFTMVGEVITLK